jgi:hypothetical protein
MKLTPHLNNTCSIISDSYNSLHINLNLEYYKNKLCYNYFTSINISLLEINVPNGTFGI